MNRILSALVNGGALGCLLTLAVWLVLRMVNRRMLNAATRYVLWWATLGIAVALPMLYWPMPYARQAEAVATPIAAPIAAPRRSLAGTTQSAWIVGRTPRSAADAPVGLRTTDQADVVAGKRVQGDPRGPGGPPHHPVFPIAVAAAGWAAWVFTAWGFVSLWLLVRLAVSWTMLERTKARACDAPEALALRACGVAGRSVRVARSAEISTPVAVGPRRPAILIPAGLFADLDQEALDQIVVHEAAHLARYDDYSLIVQRLLEAVLAPHPVVRWIARQIDLEREIACDDLVIAATGQPRRYATCLTRIVELSGGVRASLAAAMAADDTSHLSRRVDMLLDKTRHTGTHLLKARLTAMMAIVCGLAWIAGRSPGFVAFATPLARTIRQVPARMVAKLAMLPRVVDEPQAAAQAAAQAGTQVFEGRVIEDSSGNPLASAEVRFRKAGMRELAADLDTGRDGRVRAAGLPAGDYTVDVSKPNYVTASLKFTIPGEALTVRLVRYASIGGSVTDQQGQPVPGQILAPYGRTIGGARVTLLMKAEGSEQLRPVREKSLEEGGVYRIYDLPPGQYAVGLWYDGLKDGSGVQLYPDNAHPRFFTVAGGEEYKNVDFLILPRGGYQVSGKVEIPKKGEIYALALGLPEQPALPVAQTLTEPDGSFRFEKVPMGTYDLLVGGPDKGYGARTTLLGAEPKFGRTPVQVSGANVENLSIPVSAGRSLTVTLRGHGSDALPPGCPPSVSVSAELLEPWGVIGLMPAQVAFGKEQTVKNVPPGRVRLVAGGLGAGCYQVNPPVVDLSRDPTGPAAVELASAGLIRGTLRSGTARATDFAVVLLEAGAASDAQAQIAFPDAQGRFIFEGLKPGRYRMVAQPAAEASKARWIADVTKMVEVEIPGGTPTDVELPVVPKGGK